jgi:uncharacterized protein (TIGR02099 family)
MLAMRTPRALVACLLRGLARFALVAYFLLALGILVLRYVVLPQIDDYRGQVEQAVSASLELPVAIAEIDAHWQGLRPYMALHGVQVHDSQGNPALALDHVEAELSWTTLLFFELRFHRLEILAPTLRLRRAADGQLFVAGLPLSSTTADSDAGVADWLLGQRNILIRDAIIDWQDEQRAAPLLSLRHVNLHLQNSGSRHRFGLTAEPPRALADRIDLRGDFRGGSFNRLGDWQGAAYVELGYADLAGWRSWVDYPVELPQGSGALRLWFDYAGQALGGVRGDIALHDVQLRLAPELPPIELESLTGRLGGKRSAQGFELEGQRLALTTRDGIRVAPTDVHFTWTAARAGRLAQGAQGAQGAFTANGLDLDALARLAAHLPFPDAVRRQLAAFAPRGLLHELKLDWQAAAAQPAQADAVVASSPAPGKFSITTRFEGLGVNPHGALPGVSGLAGRIEGNESGGVFQLSGPEAVLELPAVFAEPRIALGGLEARARWQSREKEIEVTLESAVFQNSDAAGELSGVYVYPKGEAAAPGVIDLQGRLTRGQAQAVWRYIPLEVAAGVRDWLQGALVGGVSQETRLILKGDLQRFPFDDGSGVFSVLGRFEGASLRYVEGWPQIDDISGELEFVGKRMLIKGHSGRIFGVALSNVRAAIDDLDADHPLLLVSGQARGPTADFLRFIDDSPVAASIDHFTEGMRAEGRGALDLKLAIPLEHPEQTRINGAYQFTDDRLKVADELPLLTEVNGRLQFTENGLQVERARANLMGMPLAFDVRTAGNGAVNIDAEGSLNVAELRRQWPSSLLDQLSGSMAWRGNILARKSSAEVSITSRLIGLASTLSEPLAKTAAEALPLRFERKLLATGSGRNVVPREQSELTLGHAVTARLIHRRPGGAGSPAEFERGLVAIGDSTVTTLPDKGLAVAVNMKRIDVDAWRGWLQPSPSASPAASDADGSDKPAWPLASVQLKTPELLLFGQRLEDFDLRAQPGREGNWRADLKSRDATGELQWQPAGRGRLAARLRHLNIRPAAVSQGNGGNGEGKGGSALKVQPEDMPALDIEVDQFVLRDKPFGKLRLSADGRDGAWEAGVDIENEDGRLNGSGKWRPHSAQADVQLKFNLTARSIEKLLNRLGYADAVRRGRATLAGDVSWDGTPFALDYPTLSGQLAVDAESGQFNKLEPGVGRLLGILSLQSLPRRISLDFRDVFSEGFAFDRIEGKVDVKSGVMNTQNLQIRGPSAKVLMSGSVDLPREMQHLKVRVQPAIGESLAVGAMIANPAAGAIAWLAQKALRDPLDQAFAFEYAVSGSWAEPRVERIGAQPSAKADVPEKKR